MATTVRAELSASSKYWISRHRYYELKHFCLQYPSWKEARDALDSMGAPSLSGRVSGGSISDPTAECAEKRGYFEERIGMVERAALEADPVLCPYILWGVTTGISYDAMQARETVPCGRDEYYRLYRKFFWILSSMRK